VDTIKQVISHPQALGQCASYIKKHGFSELEAVNTAVAAKQVAEQGRLDIAAIGSEEAAEKFGLCKIETHINDASGNTTRFAVFSRAQKVSSKQDNHFIMLFTVKNVAGSLGRAVSVIGEHGFNLKALKSRPTKELIWEYYFYAEGEGNINSAEGKKMLKDLEDCCSNLKVLGSFEKEITVDYTVAQWTENFIDYLRSTMSYCNFTEILDFVGGPDIMLLSESAKQSINK
jgi:prephenate dehydratase